MHPQESQAFMNETALGKLKASLGDEDRTALEGLLTMLREYKTGAEAAGQMSPMETLLLLAVMRQYQKVECLEILLQRMAERMLEMYGERSRNREMETASG